MRYDFSKVGEIHHSFDAVLVKITDLHSREHMKIMESCEIINPSPRQELAFTKPDRLSPSHSRSFLSFFAYVLARHRFV